VLDLTVAHRRPLLVDAGRKPVAVSAGSGASLGNVFVANAGDSTVTRLDALTGRPLGSARIRALTGRPLAPVVARRIHVARTGRTVTAAIILSGGRLEPDGLRVRDGRIEEGVAKLELWQGGIGMRVGRAARHGATFVVHGAPGRLSIRIGAAPGAFTRLTARLRDSGRKVLVTLTMRPPPVQNRETGQTGSSKVETTGGSGTTSSSHSGQSVPKQRSGCAGPPPGPRYVCVNGQWVGVR
jgi:hypothetical protein